jgi:error-prone DNA polymerase
MAIGSYGGLSIFIHLHVHSPYSFLDGASDIEALAQRAASFGMPALALTDRDTVSAAVKFTQACERYGVRPILGAEVTLEDQSHLTLLAESRPGYASLCRLISAAYASGGRLTPLLAWSELAAQNEGIICLSGCRKGLVSTLVRLRRYDAAREAARNLRDWLGPDRCYIELQNDFTPDAERICRELAELADHLGVGVVATNNVHHACREDYLVWDTLRAVGTHTGVAGLHADRPLNAERFLKSARQMEEIFEWRPDALANSLRIAERCARALPDREDVTPAYPVPEGREDAAGYLRFLTYKGAGARYRPLTARVRERIEHELCVIDRLGYNDYFLMAWRTALWARRQGIRVTGRGSAADSCVAHCLQLTDVDVIVRNLPFARFLTEGKMPDIDLDFPSDRRDEVFQHLIDTYGSEHVGNVCIFSTYRAKSAVRDVGKALGLPDEALEWFSRNLSHFVRAEGLAAAFDTMPELKPFAAMRNRFELLFLLCSRIANFPRHMGTHSSGVVISRVPLSTIAPVRPSARGLVRIWEMDKDDAEVLGAIKLDILSLRTLSAVSDSEASISRQDPEFQYDRIPEDDPETYRMLRAGEAVGAFQLESSAQLSLAVTLHPRHFEDLVASVALIRPGPVRGDAVQRFVKCRNGYMRASYLHPSLVPVLAKTYGAMVYQEQAIQVIAAMTGCSEAEGDMMRKGLARHARAGTMDKLRAEFVGRACAYHRDFSERSAHLLFDMLEGWSGYGFTEGHAASFALTAYRTSYLVRHHPAAYFAGMMSHQPMGFYSSNTLAAEARRRGVTVLPVDINASDEKCTTPYAETIRLGFRLIEGMRDEDAAAIVAERRSAPFASLLDFCVRIPMRLDRLENLILAGAFDDLHPHRRGILWRLEETIAMALSYRNLTPRPPSPQGKGEEGVTGVPGTLELGGLEDAPTPCADGIAPFTAWESFLWTWRMTGVCADCHVFAYLREALARRGVLTTIDAKAVRHGRRVTVAGLNVRPHRPPTKSGKPVLFTTLEDEFGLLQCICVGDAIDSATPVFLTSAAVVAQGIIERKGTGMMLRIERTKALRMQDLVSAEDGAGLVAPPPSTRTYTGTTLRATAAEPNRELVPA